MVFENPKRSKHKRNHWQLCRALAWFGVCAMAGRGCRCETTSPGWRTIGWGHLESVCEASEGCKDVIRFKCYYFFFKKKCFYIS